jgi:hypothetical protein
MQACASKWPHSSLEGQLVLHSEVQWSGLNSKIKVAYAPQWDWGKPSQHNDIQVKMA